MKILKWEGKILETKVTNILKSFNNHVDTNECRYRENEAIFRGEFHKKWRNHVLKNEDLVDGMDNKFKNWLVKASMNHTFTFIRLLHSMLLSNEPIVTVSPTVGTQESRDAATAGDILVRYAKKQYKIKEHVDTFILHALIYGLGCLRIDWNPNAGDLIDLNEKTGEALFEGDIQIRSVTPDNYSLYSKSENLMDSYGYCEAISYDLDEATSLFPKHEKDFVVKDIMRKYDPVTNKSSELKDKVIIYEYFEKALPINGNKGRHIIFLENGTIIKKGDNPYNHKELPVVLFADVILPNSLYPVSIIDLLRSPQKQVNDLMSRILENAKLYSKVFLLVDRNSNMNDDALNDNPTIPIEYTATEGGAPPRVMDAPALPQFVFTAYDMLVQMMQHIVGIREFSRGQMPKAVSGFTANLMIEADQKVFTQVHERYKGAVGSIFTNILELIQQFWIEQKTIQVTDAENEVEAKEFMGSDLKGGFEISIDYGTSLPVDPAARRQMVQEIAQIFSQFNVPIDPTKFVDLLKLGDVMGTYDVAKGAGKRQRKETKQMMETGQPDAIDFDAEDHAAHYAELYNFFQTSEYVELEPQIQEAIKLHAQEHLRANQLQQQYPGMSEEAIQQAQTAEAQQQQQLAEIGAQVMQAAQEAQGGAIPPEGDLNKQFAQQQSPA